MGAIERGFRQAWVFENFVLRIAIFFSSAVEFAGRIFLSLLKCIIITFKTLVTPIEG